MLREAQLVGVGLMTVVIHACFLSVCVAKHHKYQICSPSSCGDMRNISYPFRLQDDPRSCGYPEYELICENNRTMINLHGGTYLVTQINYQNYTIRVVDPRERRTTVGSPVLLIPLVHITKKIHMIRLLHGVLVILCLINGILLLLILLNQYSIQYCRRLCVGGRYSVFMHHRHIYYYSTVEVTSRAQQSFDVRFAKLYASGASAFILPLFCHRQCEMIGKDCYDINFTGNVGFECKSWADLTGNTPEKNGEYKMPSYLIFGVGITVPASRKRDFIGN
ncbi:hypothetical protein CK203_057542 [Vitis vinifera]|uniref:Wall-associated receptor kinase galacturonan-binding domain-containing protein n=1 Tax=Vitis vinifera TaxID=29760 RepID=A0A438GJB9_VITVI|nr:hypothetical protein CK203_057542 [Vitis vinifera]